MRYTLIALLLIVSLPVLWFLSQLFGWHLPSYKWSVRVTMTVSTPQGEVSASNVLGSGASVTAGPKHLGYGYQLRGEATVLQLPAKTGDEQGKQRYLFLLLKDGFYYFLKQSFPKPLQEDHKWLGHVDDLKGKSPLLVPRDAYPMLVTFDDISKPETVMRVDPEDLDATFGCDRPSSEQKPWRTLGITWHKWRHEGYTPRRGPTQRDTSADCYRIKTFTLEITDEAVTKGRVEKVLVWFGDNTTLKRLWKSLSSHQRDLLSSVNWKRGE